MNATFVYKSVVWLCLLAGGTIFQTSCKGQTKAGTPISAARSVLISNSQIARVPLAEIRNRAAILTASDKLTSGVTAYRLVYRITLPEGGEGEASGLLLVPDVRRDSLTLLSYQHGTLFSKQQAPSAYRPSGSEGYVIGTAIAALDKGYAVALPDYLGYGVSASSFHPYVHRQSLAVAALQLLRAVREFAAGNGIRMRRSILLAGYSEGGYATMALHQAIDGQAAAEFPVKESYPGAGPYDILATAREVVQHADRADPAYLVSYAWVAVTYNKVYGIKAPLKDYFTPEQLPAAQALAAGDPGTALARTGAAPLFNEAFGKSIRDSTNTRMTAALKDNNVFDWRPSGKVVLYHSPDDRWVPYLNAAHALAAMKARGADITLVLLAGDHGGRAAGMYFHYLLRELQ